MNSNLLSLLLNFIIPIELFDFILFVVKFSSLSISKNESVSRLSSLLISMIVILYFSSLIKIFLVSSIDISYCLLFKQNSIFFDFRLHFFLLHH